VYDAPDPYNALRRLAPRSLVLASGQPVAKTTTRTTVGIGTDQEQRPVDLDCSFESTTRG
jgi:hypothetical protein